MLKIIGLILTDLFFTGVRQRAEGRGQRAEGRGVEGSMFFQREKKGCIPFPLFPVPYCLFQPMAINDTLVECHGYKQLFRVNRWVLEV